MPLFTLFCCFSLFFSPRHDDRHYRNLNNVWLIIYHEGAHTARFVRRKNRQNRQKWLIYYSFLSYHINYITDEQKKKKKQKQKKKQVKILFFLNFLFCFACLLLLFQWPLAAAVIIVSFLFDYFSMERYIYVARQRPSWNTTTTTTHPAVRFVWICSGPCGDCCWRWTMTSWHGRWLQARPNSLTTTYHHQPHQHK